MKEVGLLVKIKLALRVRNQISADREWHAHKKSLHEDPGSASLPKATRDKENYAKKGINSRTISCLQVNVNNYQLTVG